MNIVTEVNEWKKLRKEFINKTLGFIPTMGHLHEGHLSLCARAKTETDVVMVSIFVNPTQFNQKKDFELYPRSVEKDIELLSAEKIDYLFLPSKESLYQDGFEVQVNETNLSLELEGEYRPGHFSGMLTIVLKLLNQLQPDKAYFGEKDYQQLLLIKKMTQAFFMPTQIVGCATKRAEDGLALSSRNSRLSDEQRQKALYFPRLLNSIFTPDEITAQLRSLGFKVDYIVEKWGRRLGAVWVDDVRLIDNFVI